MYYMYYSVADKFDGELNLAVWGLGVETTKLKFAILFLPATYVMYVVVFLGLAGGAPLRKLYI